MNRLQKSLFNENWKKWLAWRPDSKNTGISLLPNTVASPAFYSAIILRPFQDVLETPFKTWRRPFTCIDVCRWIGCYVTTHTGLHERPPRRRVCLEVRNFLIISSHSSIYHLNAFFLMNLVINNDCPQQLKILLYLTTCMYFIRFLCISCYCNLNSGSKVKDFRKCNFCLDDIVLVSHLKWVEKDPITQEGNSQVPKMIEN